MVFLLARNVCQDIEEGFGKRGKMISVQRSSGKVSRRSPTPINMHVPLSQCRRLYTTCFCPYGMPPGTPYNRLQCQLLPVPFREAKEHSDGQRAGLFKDSVNISRFFFFFFLLQGKGFARCPGSTLLACLLHIHFNLLRTQLCLLY